MQTPETTEFEGLHKNKNCAFPLTYNFLCFCFQRKFQWKTYYYKVIQKAYYQLKKTLTNRYYIVGNKVKGRISRKQSTPFIFQKTNISYNLIRTRTCAYQWVRNICFSENLACFIIRRFGLITDDMRDIYSEEF